MYYVLYDPKFKRLAKRLLFNDKNKLELMLKRMQGATPSYYLTKKSIEYNKRLIIREVKSLNYGV